MRGEITALHRRLGATMIYVTHDQVEAMTMADKIVVLRGGKIEQVGTPLDLYNRPANRFVAGFIGSPRMNFVPAALTAAPAGAQGGRCASRTSAARADGRLIPAGDADHAGGTARRPRAALRHVARRAATAVTAEVAGQHAAKPDELITLHAPRAACHFFDASGLRIAGQP